MFPVSMPRHAQRTNGEQAVYIEDNPYRDIEYLSASGKFVVFAGVRPRVLVATCDSIEEAQTARDLHASGRTLKETATLNPTFETRETHAV